MVQVVGGSDVVQSGLDAADKLFQDMYLGSQLTGLARPDLIGATGDSYIPTLEARQLQENQRQNTNNDLLQRSGLQLSTAQANAQQRQAQASAEQGVLNLLAGLRGPSNAIAYNYLLRGIGAPTGQQVDPYADFRSIYQPIDFSSIDPHLLDAQAFQMPQMNPNFFQQGQQGIVNLPNRPVTPPPAAQQQQGTPRNANNQTGFTATSNGQVAQLPSSGTPVPVQDADVAHANSVYQSYPTVQAQVQAATSPTTGKIMSAQDLAAYTAVSRTAPSEAANWLRANGYLGAAQGASVHQQRRRAPANASGRKQGSAAGETLP